METGSITNTDAVGRNATFTGTFTKSFMSCEYPLMPLVYVKFGGRCYSFDLTNAPDVTTLSSADMLLLHAVISAYFMAQIASMHTHVDRTYVNIDKVLTDREYLLDYFTPI